MKRRVNKGPVIFEMGDIEKKVPLPAGVHVRSNGGIPFHKMKSGDSIFFLCNKGEKARVQSSITARASNFKRENPKLKYDFCTHQEKDGVRMWRIK